MTTTTTTEVKVTCERVEGLGWKVANIDGYELGKHPRPSVESYIRSFLDLKEKEGSLFFRYPFVDRDSLDAIQGEYMSRNMGCIISKVEPMQVEYENYKEVLHMTVTVEKPLFKVEGLEMDAPPEAGEDYDYWQEIIEAIAQCRKHGSQFETNHASFDNGHAGNISVSGDENKVTISLYLYNGLYDNIWTWLTYEGCPEDYADHVANDCDEIWMDYKDGDGDWAIEDDITVNIAEVPQEDLHDLLSQKAAEVWSNCRKISDEFFESVKNTAVWAKENPEAIEKAIKEQE